MTLAGPLHSGFVAEQSLPLVAILALAGTATAILLGLAIGAVVRRRSRPYLLIAAAIATLFVRSAVAGLTFTGLFSQAQHHLLEHGLDVVLVAFVIAAVYHARAAAREAQFEP